MTQVAQADVVRSFYNADVQYSENGTDWVDMCGYANSIAFAGEERISGETYTFCGQNAIIGYGKMTPCEITVSILYTENAAHPFQIVYNAKKNGTTFWLRWAPRGAGPGDWMWTTSDGMITACPPPVGDAAEGDPIAVEFVLRCTEVTKTNIAS